MTRADLVDWLIANGCEHMPLEGVNHSGRVIKFRNPKTNRHTYIDTPIDDKELPDFLIAQTCEQLLISSPDCAEQHKPLVKEIRERFSPKGK